MVPHLFRLSRNWYSFYSLIEYRPQTKPQSERQLLTPIGHLSISFILSQGLKAAGLPVNQKGIMLGSVLPDADYLLAPFIPRQFSHRTFSHSLLWTALTAILFRRRWGFWSTWLGGISHLAADEYNSCDTRRGRWPRMMWLFPFDLFRRPWKRCLCDMGRIPGSHAVRDMLIEGPFFLLALALIWRKEK